MKPKYQNARRLALVSAIALAATAHGAALTWDSDTITTGAQDGSGTWLTSSGNWRNTTTSTDNATWTAGDSATFGAGTDGTYVVTLGGAITTANGSSSTGGIHFANSGYTLSNTANSTVRVITVGGSSTGYLTVASGESATIGAKVTVQSASARVMGINGGGTLSIQDGGTVSNNASSTQLMHIAGGTSVNVGTNGTLLSTSNQLVIGTTSPGGSGALTVDGGTVTAGTSGSTTASGAQNIVLASDNAGSLDGTLTINSGSVTNLGVGTASGGESGLRFGSTTSGGTATGTVNLNGGTLTVARVYENASASVNSTFNFNGGTLKVTAGAGNAANFMTGLDTVSVKSGGAKIDTNGLETTIAQDLLDGGGAGGLTKEGNGTLHLTGANTYTGATIINGGKLGITAPYSSLTATTINANARLRVTTAATASSIPSVAVNANGGFEVNTGNYNAGQLAGISTSTFDNNANYVVDLTGQNIVPGDITVLTYTTKTGTGTPSLGTLPPGVTGTISDTGSAIVIDVDTPQVPSAIWSAGTGAWDTTTANWTGTTYAEGNVVIFPDLAGDNIVTLTANRSPFSVEISNLSGNTYSFAGSAISGSATVTKSGTGVATLGMANSYSGLTTISSGGLLAAADGALGTVGTGTAITSGAFLGLTGDITYSTLEPISGSGVGNTNAIGSLAVQRGFIQSSSGSNTFAGPIEINASGVTRFGTQDGADLALTGNITRASGVTGVTVLFRAGIGGDWVTVSGTGSDWDNETQVFISNTSTDAGGVRLGADDALSTIAALRGNGGSAGAGTSLDLNGYDQTVAGLAQSNGRLIVTNLLASTTSVLTLNPIIDRNTFSTTALTTIEDGAGKVAVVKSGPQKQTLAGTQTYTGSTTILGGTLALTSSGTINNTASLSIAAGTTFDVSAKSAYAIPALMPVTFKIDPTDAGSAGTIKAAADLDVSSADVTLDPLATLDDPVYILAEYTNLTGTPQFGSVTGLPSGYSIDYAHNGGTQIALVSNTLPGFASWIGGFGLAPADKDPTDDPDSDGMDNLLEFVLNGDPSVSDSGILPVLNVTTTDFEFTFQRRDDSVSPETTQTFQWGSTLATWPGSAVIPATSNTVGVANITVTAGTPNNAVTDTVKVSIPKTEAGGAGKLFGRLQVVK
jgi:autotransporter-associated beta strand protein